jgi:alkylated DNA repair dioxygenase AlkB
VPAVHWQPSLFQTEERPSLDASLAGLRRRRLDAHSWVDHLPGWVRGSDALIAEMAETAPWLPQRQRHMYDRIVDEPRVVAPYADLAALPPLVGEMRRVLSRDYLAPDAGVEFDSVLVNLYRDGHDSVAWHGDTVRKTLRNPLVVTVSLGTPRRFLMRSAAGGPTVRFLLGDGDLLVMGGAAQHDWQHTVPKHTRALGARMSITMRHSQPLPEAS